MKILLLTQIHETNPKQTQFELVPTPFVGKQTQFMPQVTNPKINAKKQIFGQKLVNSNHFFIDTKTGLFTTAVFEVDKEQLNAY